MELMGQGTCRVQWGVCETLQSQPPIRDFVSIARSPDGDPQKCELGGFGLLCSWEYGSVWLHKPVRALRLVISDLEAYRQMQRT